MNNFKYSLEKYRNRNQKHICPDCGNRSFVRYINNETNTYLDDKVGRCDHQDGCGYHYTPKEYLRDNNITTTNINNYYSDNKTYSRTRTAVPYTNSTKGTNPIKKKVDSIPFKYIEQAVQARNSTLIEYFFNLFDWQTICDTIDKYFIGCTKDRAVIYPQIGADGKARTAKIQQYDPETGKRIKDEPYSIGWVHRKLINKGLLTEDFKLSMCLFGEHLIRSDKYKNMPVGIVESEKSALIASACMPNLVWMATGSLEYLNVHKLMPLKDRKIILYPDTSTTGNAFNKWSKIAKEARRLGYDVSVSTLLEKICTDEEKAKGYDLGDYLIDRLTNPQIIGQSKMIQDSKPQKQSNILSDMIEDNPVLDTLINTFDCVEV